ncbi:MAG: CRISPR-associated protein Cas5 [Synergistales bacterium 58_81]|nr:MAG: CRISPR-associated protein Cas5 [Synergistales bacterium 58_81]
MFDLKGKLGHFRRPDTTGTHATYPFISRTALRGLLASVLGMEQLDDADNFTALRLLSPISTCTQEMSMLGKGFESGGNNSFNRPTAVEFVVNPHYRIYYTGKYIGDLAEKISSGQSCYHTYLGSAYCLTFPEFVDMTESFEVTWRDRITTKTIVPTSVISSLSFRENIYYSRVSGMQYRYLGGRQFENTIDFIYSDKGDPIEFVPLGKGETCPIPVNFADVSGETLCLW